MACPKTEQRLGLEHDIARLEQADQAGLLPGRDLAVIRTQIERAEAKVLRALRSTPSRELLAAHLGETDGTS